MEPLSTEFQKKSSTQMTSSALLPYNNSQKLFFRANLTQIQSDLRYIYVRMVRPSTVIIVKTATMTAIDMISNIGGTLGLFSGFSIISGLEILYWITLVIKGKLKKETKWKL